MIPYFTPMIHYILGSFLSSLFFDDFTFSQTFKLGQKSSPTQYLTPLTAQKKEKMERKMYCLSGRKNWALLRFHEKCAMMCKVLQ